MAYAPRPDGLNDVVLDDGTRVPSSLSVDQLRAMGHAPIPMPQGNPFGGLPPNAVAGPGGNPDETLIANTFQAQQAPQQSGPFPGGRLAIAPGTQLIEQPTPTGKPRPDFASGVQQIQAEAPQANPQAAPARRELVPLSGGGPQQGSPYTYAPPGQGRAVKLKGGDVRASFVRQPGEEVGDDVKSDLLNNDPEQADLNAVENYDEREQQRIDVTKQLQSQQQQVDQATARRSQIDQMLQQKQQLIDQRDAEAERLTPQTAREVWEDKPALARVFAGLAMVLGGALQGLQGRATNPGLDMINQSIRDEVNDQRARYEAALKKGQTVRNDYSQALTLYGTPEAASLDLEMRRNALAAKLIQNQGESITNRDRQQAAFQTADQMRQQRAELKLKLNDLEKGKILQENWVNVPDRYATVGGAPKIPKEARERLVRMPDGNYGFVRASEARDKVQGKLTAGADILNGLQKLKSLSDTANLHTDLKARAEYEAIAADTLPLVNVAAGQGAISKGDQDNVEKLLGSPGAVLTDNGARLEQAIRAQQSRLNSTIRDNVHADPDALYPYTSARPQTKSDE
jgi:hypothetical protein